MKKIDINTYINYLIVAYAFSFPISKAAVSILEVLILLLWIYQGNWKYKFNLLKSNVFIGIVGAFILYSIISVLWASDPLFAINYIGKYHHMLMIPVIYTSLEKKYIRHIFSAFLLSVFVSEIISYGIIFDLFTYKNATAQFPTPFTHHITYSIFLAFTSTILLLNILNEKDYKYKILNFLFFTTVVTNLFMNGGRTGQVAFIIMMFTLLLMSIKNKLKAFVIASIVIFSTLFLAFNYSDNFASRIQQFENGISKIIHEKDFTDQGGMRASMWIVGTNVFLDNMIFGTGIGDEMKDADHYASLYDFKVIQMDQLGDYHNVFINQAAQLGIVGLVLILLMFYLLATLKFATKKYYVLNIMFVISFLLYSMTHNTIHLMNSMVYFALFSGVFNAISKFDRVNDGNKYINNSLQ